MHFSNPLANLRKLHNLHNEPLLLRGLNADFYDNDAKGLRLSILSSDEIYC